MAFFKTLLGLPAQQPKATTDRDLIRQEAAIGAQLFGPVPAGHRREFFCLDAHTWIWFEEWRDSNGQLKSVTTRYEVSKHNIVKIQDGQHAQQIRGKEAETFVHAVSKYYALVAQHVYGLTPA